MKSTHLFSGIFLCAFILLQGMHFVMLMAHLPQMGDLHNPRIRVGDIHWQKTMEVVIRRVSHSTDILPCSSHPQPHRI